jgi:hypothetical protein
VQIKTLADKRAVMHAAIAETVPHFADEASGFFSIYYNIWYNAKTMVLSMVYKKQIKKILRLFQLELIFLEIKWLPALK